MLGFLQTIIDCINWIVDFISQIAGNIVGFFHVGSALVSVVADNVDVIPVPVLAVGWICFQVMATRLILTLGFRG